MSTTAHSGGEGRGGFDAGLRDALHQAAAEQGFDVVYTADAESYADRDDTARAIIISHDWTVVCVPKEVEWKAGPEA